VNQERPDELWVGRRDTANQLFVKILLCSNCGTTYADLPAATARATTIHSSKSSAAFYGSIAAPNEARDYPQFTDGVRQLILLMLRWRATDAREASRLRLGSKAETAVKESLVNSRRINRIFFIYGMIGLHAGRFLPGAGLIALVDSPAR